MNQLFKLKGLNRRGKKGVYATVECGKEDWFHTDFDVLKFPIDRQYALFDLFDKTEDNLWNKKNHQVEVRFDKFSTGGVPVNPLIVDLILDEI